MFNLSEYIKENSILHGDSRDVMKKIESNSVSVSFWSPPYNVGKDYEKDVSFSEWKSLILDILKEHFRIIKPGGFVVVNVDDVLAFPDEKMPRIQAVNKAKLRSKVTKEDVLKEIQAHPDYNRDKLAKVLGVSEQTIDRRLHGNNIRGGKKKIQTKVKIIGGIIEEFAEQAGFYMYDRRIWAKDPAWQNSQWHSNSYKAVSEFEYLYFLWKPGVTIVDRKKLTHTEWVEWGSRGIWNIPSVRRNDDHPAKFPEELAQRVIKLLSEPNDIILDPFLGSGTTAIAAIHTDRKFIGIEKEKKYYDLAVRKVRDSVEEMKNVQLDLNI